MFSKIKKWWLDHIFEIKTTIFTIVVVAPFVLLVVMFPTKAVLVYKTKPVEVPKCVSSNQ